MTSRSDAGRRKHRGGQQVRRKLKDFLRDESGATAIEYGLIASGIGLAIITIVKGLGTNLKTTFGSISTAVK